MENYKNYIGLVRGHNEVVWRNVWKEIAQNYIVYCFKKGSLYYRLNKEFFSFVFPFLSRKSYYILDLDSGPGNKIAYFGKRLKNSMFIGIDKEENFIKHARKVAKQEKIKAKFYLATAEDFLKSCQEMFDLVIANSSLWHMNLKIVFSSIRKILKKEGFFVFNLAPHVVGEPKEYNPEEALDVLCIQQAKKIKIYYRKHAMEKKITKKLIKKLSPRNLEIVKFKKIGILQTKRDFIYFCDKLIIPRTYAKRYPYLEKEKAISLLKENVRKAFETINKNNRIVWRWHFYAIKNV